MLVSKMLITLILSSRTLYRQSVSVRVLLVFVMYVQRPNTKAHGTLNYHRNSQVIPYCVFHIPYSVFRIP